MADRAFLWAVLAALGQNDFAFSVVVAGIEWDIYRFQDGGPGMVAIRVEDEKVRVGFFRRGVFTQAEVETMLLPS